MLDGARADARECFPEADGVVVTCGAENNRHIRVQSTEDCAIDTMSMGKFGFSIIGNIVRYEATKGTIMQPRVNR